MRRERVDVRHGGDPQDFTAIECLEREPRCRAGFETEPGATIDRHGQNGAAQVVDVVADQIDASRREAQASVRRRRDDPFPRSQIVRVHVTPYRPRDGSRILGKRRSARQCGMDEFGSAVEDARKHAGGTDRPANRRRESA